MKPERVKGGREGKLYTGAKGQVAAQTHACTAYQAGAGWEAEEVVNCGG